MSSQLHALPVKTKAAKDIIFTDKAPLPLGTYSQAVQTGNLVFLSAQTPVSPLTGQVEAKDFEGQMRQRWII